jgi:lysine 2,3-aminomutase
MKKDYYPEWYNKNRYIIWPEVHDNEWYNWKWQYKNRITDVWLLKEILKKFKIDNNNISNEYNQFAITPYFFSLINFENFDNDPIAKQIIPSFYENENNQELFQDPFLEKKISESKKIIKRYPDRVVITVTNQCPSYCRYCTRKWMWNEKVHLTSEDLESIKKYLIKNTHIREVIISGGEPLLLSYKRLDQLLKMLFSLHTIEVVRIASRILSFLPQRMTPEILKVLSRYKPIWFITHFNHAQELTPLNYQVIDKMISSGLVLCNQSVLLKQINDQSNTMKDLVLKLQRFRIKPYYIFQCDLVNGTHHFRSSIKNGMHIMKILHGTIGGIAIPDYVIDLPDGGKIPILPDYIQSCTKDEIVFKNYEGKICRYPNTEPPLLTKK